MTCSGAAGRDRGRLARRHRRLTTATIRPMPRSASVAPFEVLELGRVPDLDLMRATELREPPTAPPNASSDSSKHSDTTSPSSPRTSPPDGISLHAAVGRVGGLQWTRDVAQVGCRIGILLARQREVLRATRATTCSDARHEADPLASPRLTLRLGPASGVPGLRALLRARACVHGSGPPRARRS